MSRVGVGVRFALCLCTNQVQISIFCSYPPINICLTHKCLPTHFKKKSYLQFKHLRSKEVKLESFFYHQI